MNESVRCVDCFWFGCFRTEVLRGGGTTCFDPETLPLGFRQAVTLCSALHPLLEALNARDRRVACLQETTDAGGIRRAIEAGFDTLNSPEGDAAIRVLSTGTRSCSAFAKWEPSLTFAQLRALQEKHRTDIIAERVFRQQRAIRYRRLLQSLEALDFDPALTAQQRGKRFECWFGELFAAESLKHTLDVRNECEQLDFTVSFGNLFAIGEVRWLSAPVDTRQVRDFFGKLSDRPPFVIGILVSMSGCSRPALNWLATHSHERTVVTFTRTSLQMAISSDVAFSQTVVGELNERLEHPRSS